MSGLRLHLLGGLYLTREGRIVEGPAAKRKALALLAMLAVSGAAGVTRERLAGCLWGDSSDEQAMHALKQLLYEIRKGLAVPRLILGKDALRLNSEACSSDLDDLRFMLGEGRFDQAATLYRGPLLEGIYLNEQPGFQRWLETEQARLAHGVQVTLRRAAVTLEHERRFAEAADLWSVLVQQDPLSDTNELGLARALDGAGDRAAAVCCLYRYTKRLRRELDTDPAPEVSRTLRSLKVRWTPGETTRYREPLASEP